MIKTLFNSNVQSNYETSNSKIRLIQPKPRKPLKKLWVEDYTPSERETEPAPPANREIIISEAQQKKAKECIAEALDYHTQSNAARALKAVRKAIEHNPTLKTDHYFLGLVATITGLHEDDAMELVLNHSASKQFALENQQQSLEQRKLEHEANTEKISWMPAIIDLSLHLIIVGVGLFLTAMIVLQNQSANLALAETGNTAAATLAELGAALGQVSTFTLLGYALAMGAASMFAMFMQNMTVRFLAKMMGGRGTLRFLIEKTMPIDNKFGIIVFVTVNAAVMMTAGDFGMLALLPLAVIGIGVLVVMMKESAHIGRAFDFGTMRGMIAWLFGTTVSASIMGLIVTAVASLF